MQFFLCFLVSVLLLGSVSGYLDANVDNKLLTKQINNGHGLNKASMLIKQINLDRGSKDPSSRFVKSSPPKYRSKDHVSSIVKPVHLDNDSLSERADHRHLDRQIGGSSLFGTGYEYSLGSLNTLFGLTGTTSTFGVGNLSYITLGIIFLIPLIIGLALIFYLVGGSGAAAAVLKRADAEFAEFTEARNNEMSFNPYGIDWEKFTILDWISVAEDTWRNFQPSNLDCQKRLICELHQNTMRFGYVAKKMVDLFSYLEYAELLRLPEEAKTIIDDYMDAADRGRSLKKDCGDIYFGCDFSVKKIFDKVTDNEI